MLQKHVWRNLVVHQSTVSHMNWTNGRNSHQDWAPCTDHCGSPLHSVQGGGKELLGRYTSLCCVVRGWITQGKLLCNLKHNAVNLKFTGGHLQDPNSLKSWWEQSVPNCIRQCPGKYQSSCLWSEPYAESHTMTMIWTKLFTIALLTGAGAAQEPAVHRCQARYWSDRWKDRRK